VRAKGLQRKRDYIRRVTRGEGFMPWQARESSCPEEDEFRSRMERRKGRMLACRTRVRRPVLLTDEDLARARKNAKRADWAREWLDKVWETAEHVASQPDGYVEEMLPELTPTNPYGFTCPNCVGTKSLEGMAYTSLEWDYRRPDIVRCGACGQTYPDPKFPETGRLICPRRNQTFTYLLNEEERKHPRDRSGKHAWCWVGKPMHTSFTGAVREYKILFAIDAAKSLALAYCMTQEFRYAERALGILLRLAHCYRHWLYHDFYDTIADCDPLFAAWHHTELKLEWKRHLCAFAYGGSRYETGPVDDTLARAKMLATYFGSGRIHPSTDSISRLADICLAYDLIFEARRSDETRLLTAEARAKIERDLILESLLAAEPFVRPGGPTRANNKAPSVYYAQAAAAKCLGLPELADAALRGYEAVRDKSFLFDGFSRESPSYTNMFLNTILLVPETLHGFRWPRDYAKRRGIVDEFRSDAKLELIMRTAIETLRPDGRFLPLSDTLESSSPSPRIFEIGLRRFPELFAGTLPTVFRGQRPSEYAALHLDSRDVERDAGLDLPETLSPAWGTAVLRHGSGTDSTVLALAFNPPGVHRHGDNLGLYYSDRGDGILGDQGYVCDTPFLGWIHSTLSHNLVVVDDQPQLFRGERPRRPSLQMMVTSPRVSVVEASSRAYEQCREYRRLVVLVKGPGAETFAIDVFRVRGGRKHAFRLFSELAASDASGASLEFANLDMPPAGPLPGFGGSIRPEHVFGLRDVRRSSDPPASWSATWRQKGRRYRLHMLRKSDAVEASHGPGQETLDQIGRRVRYVDTISTGKDLTSRFVAIHEPSGPRNLMPIRRAERVEVPRSAGPDAVALRIDSKWGDYLVLSDFAREAEVVGVQFQGRFGILCRTPQTRQWLLACGSGALTSDGFGFRNAPSAWAGRITKQTEHALTSDTPRPKGWPCVPGGVKPCVLTGSAGRRVGLPVKHAGRTRIEVGGFPLQPSKRFHLPAVQFIEE